MGLGEEQLWGWGVGIGSNEGMGSGWRWKWMGRGRGEELAKKKKKEECPLNFGWGTNRMTRLLLRLPLLLPVA